MKPKYYYILFMNKKKNFATDMKIFKKYHKAFKWLTKHLDNAHHDMIKPYFKK